MKTGLLLLIGVMFASPLISQDSTILWTDDVRLTWSDFLAPAPENHEAAAMTDVTQSIEMHSEGEKLIITVIPAFNRYTSWGKEKDRSPYLLQHEQLHFDIHELNTRRLRAELKTLKVTFGNVQSVLDKVLRKHNQLNLQEQDRYDKETNHSLNDEAQKRWNEYVEKELKKLKAHSDVTFSIPVKP